MYISTAWSKVMALDGSDRQSALAVRSREQRCEGRPRLLRDVVRTAAWRCGRDASSSAPSTGGGSRSTPKTGAKVWEVVTVDQKKPYTITGAPRAVRDKVFIGNSGAELGGVRGYLSA